MTLQRELGELNYYEGPITGTMNAATEAVLQHFLATGNNQMGG